MEKLPVDHEPEEEGEICGEVRGEGRSHKSGMVGEVSPSAERQPICLISEKFCLITSAGAEALRSDMEEQGLTPCHLFPPSLSLYKGGGSK